jgi:hypothetical protein
MRRLYLILATSTPQMSSESAVRLAKRRLATSGRENGRTGTTIFWISTWLGR